MANNALGFKEWANKESVSQSASIDQLRDRRIGIDGDVYVHDLLFTHQQEPLLTALGGLPFSLHKRIDLDLQYLHEAGIEPIFVFNGLDLACKDKASVIRESRKAENTLKSAWSIYDEGHALDAVKAFGKLSLYRSEHIVRKMQFYLRSRGAYVQIAPYSAAAQLVYMEREGFIETMSGSASCLLFGADRVITSFEWELRDPLANPPTSPSAEYRHKDTFTWVTLERCLKKLGVSRDQFVNLCLLSGSSILPTFPEIDSDADDAAATRLPAARAMMNRVSFDIHNLLHDSKDESYRELFQKAKFALRHPVIATQDGKVEPLNWESGPGDAHEYSGQKLPEEIYAYLTYGVIGPRVLNWRTRMEIVDTPPLDGGNSNTYRNLVQDKLRPLRAQALALMTPLLHRYYQKQDVSIASWWNESSKTPLNIADVAESSKGADGWHVKAESFPSSLTAQSTPLTFAIASLVNDADAKKTVTPRAANAGPPLRNAKELRVNATWRFLEDRGYINTDHTLSARGKAYRVALDRASTTGLTARGVTDTEVEEAILLAFELIQLESLSSESMFPAPPYNGAPLRGSQEDRAHALFVTRVACLGAFHHDAIGYTGPLSRNILAYHQMAAAVRGALRDLVEMHACKMLLSGAVHRNLSKSEYADIGANLPFLNEPDIGLALVVKSYLDEQSRPQAERTEISIWFAHAADISGDLEKAWQMWDAVNAGVQAADSSIISAATKQNFKKTDEWLAQKRSSEAIPNGTE